MLLVLSTLVLRWQANISSGCGVSLEHIAGINRKVIVVSGILKWTEDISVPRTSFSDWQGVLILCRYVTIMNEKLYRRLVTPRSIEWICPTFTPSNTWFSGLTWVSHPNGISIGSSVFAGITNATNRQSDRQKQTDRLTTLLRDLMLWCGLLTLLTKN